MAQRSEEWSGRGRSPGRRTRVGLGLFLAALLAYEWHTQSPQTTVAGTPEPGVAFASDGGEGGKTGASAATNAQPISAAPPIDLNAYEALLKSNPLAAIEQARDFHRRNVRDYACTFIKQELLDHGLSSEQTIHVRFMQEPYSVLMHWVRNPGAAERVIYVAGRWVNPDASSPAERELAVCQPGAVARIFVKSVREPIRGDRAKKESRRFIDDFGFLKALDLMVEYSRLGQQRGEMKLWYEGIASFDGRPTFVIKRTLPYSGPASLYPDGSAEYHLDREWLVPVAVYSYADLERRKLLGKYEYRDVRMNVGCQPGDFEPSKYGM